MSLMNDQRKSYLAILGKEIVLLVTFRQEEQYVRQNDSKNFWKNNNRRKP